MIPEIGIVRRQDIPAREAPVTVAAAELFAAAIARRFQPQSVTVSRAELALAWEAPPQINYYTTSQTLHIYPGVTVEERYLPAGTSRDVRASEAGVLFGRLFSRQARLEAFEPAREATRGQASIARGGRELEIPARPAVVERHIPRPAAAPQSPPLPVEPIAASPSGARDTDWGTPFARRETPKPITLAAPEIKRVADQVMREIDHRITARRERMGRR